MKKTNRHDEYEGSLHLVHGFQRLRPIHTISTVIPVRVRYMYIDRILGSGQLSTTPLFREHAVSTLKYESVEPSYVKNAQLVVVKCTVHRRDVGRFLETMAHRHQQMLTLEVRGYKDFCLGLHVAAVKARQEVYDEGSTL